MKTYLIPNTLKQFLFKQITLFFILCLTFIFFISPDPVGAQQSNLAVTPPGFDDMGAVLEKMGIYAQEVTSEELADSKTWKKYDAIYLNCGTISPSDEITSALREYVRNGGIIYASDFVGELIEAAFPEKINFYSEDKNNPDQFNARVGEVGEVTATITDSGLSSIVGKNKININFDAGGWVLIDSVNSGVRVHIRGDAKITAFDEKKSDFVISTVKDKPFVVSFSEGKGEVLFTSFHNEAQVTSDVEKILTWFAIRTKSGAFIKDARETALKNNKGVILQENVDSVSQEKAKKEYKFNATGKADFVTFFAFEDGIYQLKITDPKGEELVNEKITKTNFQQKISATSGTYKISIEAIEVPQKNTVLVLSFVGDKKASKDPVFDENARDGGGFQISIDWQKLPNAVIIIVIVAVVLFVLRKKIFKNPNQKPGSKK